MLEVKNISASYNNNRLFTDLSFSVSAGSTTVILGPNGCGKTTLLSVIASQKKADKGSVMLSGRQIIKGDSRISFILQTFGIFPWFTVLKNLLILLKIKGIKTSEAMQKAEWAMKYFDLLPYKNRYPNSLSGGEKQRLAIARALVIQPQLLLMDEPLSSIDAITREEMQLFLRKLLSENLITSVLVTHSVEEAVILGDRICIMKQKPSQGFAQEISISRNFKSKKDTSFFLQVNNIKEIMEKYK